MGIIVCVIFVFRKRHPFDQFPNIYKGTDLRSTHKFSCSIYTNKCDIFTLDILLSKEFGKIESYQLWLHSFPLDTYSGTG